MYNRQIVLDTETTGMNKFIPYYKGHKIIEIGAVEIINRRITGKRFHVYLKPNRNIDPGAFHIHGISNKFLFNKPIFADIVDKFINFINGSELIIHNARFDIEFINYELSMINININKIEDLCNIIDTLKLARKMFPGKRNTLDALCNRYFIKNTKRTLHGALLDAEILAKIFLLMTGGQISLPLINQIKEIPQKNKIKKKNIKKNLNLCHKIIYANKKEIISHKKQLNLIKKKNGICIWKSFDNI